MAPARAGLDRSRLLPVRTLAGTVTIRNLTFSYGGSDDAPILKNISLQVPAGQTVAIVGRSGGKSRIVSFAAVYIACFHDFSKYLAKGERGMVLCLASDRDQARTVFSYMSAILQAVPALKQMVSRQTADEIDEAGMEGGIERPARARPTRRLSQRRAHSVKNSEEV